MLQVGGDNDNRAQLSYDLFFAAFLFAAFGFAVVLFEASLFAASTFAAFVWKPSLPPHVA